MPAGCLPLLILALLLLIPLFLTDVTLTALVKLGLSPQASFLAAFGIFFGGLVNVPVKRIPRDETIEVMPFTLFGFGRVFPQWVRRRTYTVLAVNLGGCLVPAAIAVYELVRLAGIGGGALLAALTAAAINIVVCYRLARPVSQVGIALPAFVPALIAAACGLLFLPDQAPPIAFTAGVLGPLIGADLLHLRDLQRIGAGVASIGGAGTFDGIVLSALIATLLA
jgi:uncharacterized membrane protein